MSVHLPEDLVSLFALATRDVIWYKESVLRAFRRADVPVAIMIELERRRDEPTVRLCQYLIDVLEARGAEGLATIQRLVATVAEWKDLSHLKPDKRPLALERQRNLKEAIRQYADRERYRIEKEKESQREREDRTRIGGIDHRKLSAFRDRFDTIFAMADRRAKGDALEALLNDIFSYYCQKSLGPFTRTSDGEQIDGQFYFDGHYYYVEVRWREAKANAADISVLRDRAAAGFGGDVRALFISFNGYSQECLRSLRSRTATERAILMDGSDLRTVLNGDIAFDVLLDEKLARAVRDEGPFITARQIILERME